MKNNLIVLGDVFYDRIFYVDGFSVGNNHVTVKKEEKVGGLINFVSAIRRSNFKDVLVLKGKHKDIEIEDKICLYLNRHDYRCQYEFLIENRVKDATIIVDRVNNTRTSVVSWGDRFFFNQDRFEQHNRKMKKFKPKWIHFMYVDMFNPIVFKRFEKPDNCIVSVDFCQSEHNDENFNNKLFDFIKNKVNFVFCGREEFKSFFKDKNKSYDLFHKQNVNYINHSPRCCYVCYEGKTIEIMNNFYKETNNYNVLGAGDYFSALVVSDLINGEINKNKIVNTIKKAQIDILKYLK